MLTDFDNFWNVMCSFPRRHNKCIIYRHTLLHGVKLWKVSVTSSPLPPKIVYTHWHFGLKVCGANDCPNHHCKCINVNTLFVVMVSISHLRKSLSWRILSVEVMHALCTLWISMHTWKKMFHVYCTIMNMYILCM